MSEPRKNHLTIDGGQVKEDDQAATYKPIPESDTEFRPSKSNLSKSKDKVSADEAEEKLLQKEDEAKIVTRVDMADAKYVVGDHRNGDAKIELDANKRQFSGLTKEELLKYADDPFWVNLRWFMFVLFWAAWLAMLAGAVAIILKAPKCAPPTPKTWYEKGPLVDAMDLSYAGLEQELPVLQKAKVAGVFMEAQSYEVLEKPEILEQFTKLVQKAKDFGIKIIVDLTPNFVPKNHTWFQLSENRTEPYTDYFVWRSGQGFRNGVEQEPNNWVSMVNEKAWTLSESRKEFYLHHFEADKPDLNFRNPEVKEHFNKVLEKWMKAGAFGVRLSKVRQLLVNSSFSDNIKDEGKGSKIGVDHTHHLFWRQSQTSDQPELDDLLAEWVDLVEKNSVTPGDAVFTIEEVPESRVELFVLDRNLTALKPPSTAPITLQDNVTAFVTNIDLKLNCWPAMQLLTSGEDMDKYLYELSALALLLPVAPVFTVDQIREDNDTAATESLSHLVALREDASVAHGEVSLATISARNSSGGSLIACARWKPGHTGFVAVFNPSMEELRANLTSLSSIPNTLTVHHMSHDVRTYTNYTNNYAESADNVLVPPRSSIVLSYVPVTTAKN